MGNRCWFRHLWLSLSWVLTTMAGSALLGAEPPSAMTNSYRQWPHGPSADSGFFPLAVWLQDPANAERYANAGFNTYIGLWQGPTEAQLAALRKAGVRVICEQNNVALRHLEDPTIIGWMHGDEPDNAQSLETGEGWGPPPLPEEVVETCRRLHAADPSRPVLLNLGQGVAWDGWYGRGTRSNHPEDYPNYLEGCDIASFDIYPVVHDRPEVAGKLWFVARGVERLVQWSEGRKIVWNCLECTRISNPQRKPTPHQVRAEAWMSLVHGSRGLIYFVHQFKPVFRESALLDDAEMLEAVSVLNRQITRLAPVLNSPPIPDGLTLESSNPTVPVATSVKRMGGEEYVFAVAMRDGTTTATITPKGLSGDFTVEVLGEDRSVAATMGSFKDRFGPWDVHLYRLVRGGGNAK
jgi:hypothetical protein